MVVAHNLDLLPDEGRDSTHIADGRYIQPGQRRDYFDPSLCFGRTHIDSILGQNVKSYSVLGK